MDAIRYLRAQEVFQQARQLPASQQDAFVAGHCTADRELREQVFELLLASRTAIEDGLSDGALREGRGRWDGWLDGMAVQHPERVGPYRVLRRLGQGGMGVVYEAQQEAPRRSVALKLIHPVLVDENNLRRFRREAELLGRLSHRGIAQIYEFATCEIGGQIQPYFAMQYVEGRPLLEACREGCSSAFQRIELVARVCDAIQHAHERGIVHRDLKSENILVNEARQPTVLDFGIALSLDADQTRHTRGGQVLGSMVSMSPEQLRGRTAEVDQRSDVFSLGVLLFEALSGEPPFFRDNVGWDTAVRSIETLRVPRLRRFDRSLPADLQTVVQVALDPNPVRRYGDAGSFGAELRRVLRAEPIEARPTSVWYRLRKFAAREKALSIALSAVMMALVVGSVVAVYFGLAARDAQRASVLSEGETERALYHSEMLRGCTIAAGDQIGSNLRELVASWGPKQPRGSELRGWEWDYLRNVVHRPRLAIPTGEVLYSVAWAPDGERLATGGNCVKIWDSRSGALLSTLHAEQELRVMELDWSPDGRFLAAGTARSFAVWDLSRGSLVQEWPAARTLRIRWAANGILLATGANETLVFDPAFELPIATIPRRGEVWALSPDGETMAVSARSGGIQLYRGLETQPLRSFRLPSESADLPLDRGAGFCELRWSPDGQRILGAAWDSSVWTVDVETGDVRELLSPVLQLLCALAWNAEGTVVAVAGQDSVVRVLRVEDSVEIQRLSGHRGPVYEVDWSPQGQRLASVGGDGVIRIVQTDSARARMTFQLPMTIQERRDGRIEFSSDGRRVLAQCEGCSGVYDTEDYRDLGPVAYGENWSSSRPFWLAREGVLDAVTRKIVRAPLGGAGHRWNPTDGGVVAGVDGGSLWVQDVRVEECRWVREYNPRMRWTGLRWSPDGRRLAICRQDGYEVLDAEDGGVFPSEANQGNYRVVALDWSPDGRELALASADEVVGIVDSTTGVLRLEVGHHGSRLSAVAWHPGGSRIASGAEDGAVLVWDSANGALCAGFDFDCAVFGLCWSPDGDKLAALTQRGEVRVWSAAGRMPPE